MIRAAQPKDCISLAALSIQVWLETYAVEGIRTTYSTYAISTFTESYFLKLLNHPDYRLLVSEIDVIYQGYVLVNLASDFNDNSNGFEVEKLYVHSKFSGQGIGRRLLEQVQKNYGDKFWLYTWVENESNHFYRHLGFTKLGLLSFEFDGQQIENNVYGFNGFRV
ncbi:GNAT family N-acetyltransferase [Psychrobium sp. 1_MG-2023]|uniref:GNAT family N-acetyltransferase n=1 Tax=Psychrobium sp. 1_MG-2023 TaxID=3062624 RepID=UPI000C3465F1|nr:N-acetyltransferase [Psychrobium sp. 1_MG-2023]MDP2559637.1 N-acetyltransferase [Psychrobium sp. 1_MG-2023]PKF59469.1 N-acetyltransferase [Alteromonadales bacterium alter-6D02]